MSVGQRKIFNPHEEPQIFGIHAPMLYHQATETLWARLITKFTYDKHTVQHTATVGSAMSIALS